MCTVIACDLFLMEFEKRNRTIPKWIIACFETNCFVNENAFGNESLLVIKSNWSTTATNQTKTLCSWKYLIIRYWYPVNSLRPSEAYMSVDKTTVASNNGLSPVRHWAIIWTNTGLLLIGPLGTNVSDIGIKIQQFSYKNFENVVCKMAAILSWPQCLAKFDWGFMSETKIILKLTYMCPSKIY